MRCPSAPHARSGTQFEPQARTQRGVRDRPGAGPRARGSRPGPPRPARAPKIAGAAYLVYLGVHAIRHRGAFGAGDLDPEHASLPWRTSLRQGFVVGASNPKSFILAAAVVPQFVDRGAGQVQLQIFLLGLIAVVIALLSDSLWAVLAARLRDWFSRSPRREERLGAVGGLSMIGLGVSVAFTGDHAK